MSFSKNQASVALNQLVYRFLAALLCVVAENVVTLKQTVHVHVCVCVVRQSASCTQSTYICMYMYIQMYKCEKVHMHVAAASSLQCLTSFHSYVCVVFMNIIEVNNQHKCINLHVCTCHVVILGHVPLVELQPRTLKIMGSNPTQGSNFSLKGCCLGI